MNSVLEILSVVAAASGWPLYILEKRKNLRERRERDEERKSATLSFDAVGVPGDRRLAILNLGPASARDIRLEIGGVSLKELDIDESLFPFPELAAGQTLNVDYSACQKVEDESVPVTLLYRDSSKGGGTKDKAGYKASRRFLILA